MPPLSLLTLVKISRYISTLKDLISHNDWYNPIAKLFEEDFLEVKEQPQRSLSTSETTPIGNQASVPKRKGRPQKIISPQKASSSTPPTEITITIDLASVKQEPEDGPNPVLQVDGGRHFDRRGKRNPPRTSTGKQPSEPTIIEGHALGVRKSLSVEELSRETLVAPNRPAETSLEAPQAQKAYSLRENRRVPYKT